MFNIQAIIILIRSIFHALDKYIIHQIQFRVLLKISQDATIGPDNKNCVGDFIVDELIMKLATFHSYASNIVTRAMGNKNHSKISLKINHSFR